MKQSEYSSACGAMAGRNNRYFAAVYWKYQKAQDRRNDVENNCLNVEMRSEGRTVV